MLSSLSSLSDRSKTFIVYSAVLVVAVCNIVFSLSWVAGSGPQSRLAAAIPGAGNAPIAAAPFAPYPPDDPQTIGNDVPVPKKAPLARAAGDAAQAKCDVDACAEAYRSFRASDCTYMTNAGVRRLCTKGSPPQ